MANENYDINQDMAKRMFEEIRRFEVKNVRTQKNDDKKMATSIAKYLLEKSGGKWQ